VLTTTIEKVIASILDPYYAVLPSTRHIFLTHHLISRREMKPLCPITILLFLEDSPKLPPSLDKIFVVFMYAALVVIWLIIAWEVGSSAPRLQALLGMGKTRRRLLTAGLFISLSLAWDAGYWLFATAAKNNVLPWLHEAPFYIPIVNGLEKVPLILSAAAFLWTFRLIGRLTTAELDRRYFARFAERTLDAIIVLDPEGRARYWNKSAEVMFGWESKQVMGELIQGFMIPDDCKQKLDEILEKVRSEKQGFLLAQTYGRTSAGNKIAVSIDIAPILDPDFQGFFSIVRPAEPRNPFTDNPYFPGPGLPDRVANKAFVAMPYVNGLDIWGQLIQPIAEELNLTLVRADQQADGYAVVEREGRDIASSELVIANLTGDNPNVYYEIGIAHALGIETVLLRTSEEIPFSVRHLRSIYCNPNDLTGAKEEVRKAIGARRRC
jgi:PAS domain S-box-containing protein